jgi:hypothetical protein
MQQAQSGISNSTPLACNHQVVSSMPSSNVGSVFPAMQKIGIDHLKDFRLQRNLHNPMAIPEMIKGDITKKRIFATIPHNYIFLKSTRMNPYPAEVHVSGILEQVIASSSLINYDFIKNFVLKPMNY